jgi:ATPase subunit of ABC transporter with duplicated ATPase domains
MKKIRIILVAASLLVLFVFPWQAAAQEKTKEEKERELKMAEEIDAQKKAIADQKKAQEEVRKAMEQSRKQIDEAMKEYQEQFGNAEALKELAKTYKGDRSFYIGEPFSGETFRFVPGMDGMNWFSHSSENERTTWDLSKSLKEKSYSNDYTFDVDQSAKSVVMSVNGDCKEGEIRIKVIMPNGKTYADIVIDEFGNLNWRKSFSISEEENKDKIGSWKFKVSSEKATGVFKISLQAF